MILLDQLRKGAASKENTATLDRPLDHLVACHDRILQRLATLERAGAALVDDAETRRDEAVRAIQSAMAFFDLNGAWHTADEEQSVFPRLKGLSESEVDYLAELETQHTEADEVMLDVHAAAKEVEAGGDAKRFVEVVAELCVIYRAHIASENERLIEIGRRRLSAGDLTAIASEMKARRDGS